MLAALFFTSPLTTSQDTSGSKFHVRKDIVYIYIMGKDIFFQDTKKNRSKVWTTSCRYFAEVAVLLSQNWNTAREGIFFFTEFEDTKQNWFKISDCPENLKKPYHPALSLGFIFTWCLINIPNHTISLQMQPIMTGVKRSPMAVWRRQQLLKLPPAHPEPPFLGPSSPQFSTSSHQRKMVMVVSYFYSWGIVI